jgi:hypothetical protein
MSSPISEGRKEAAKTYLEQTKLLVTLASAFLFAPAGLVAILKDRSAAGLTVKQLSWFIVAEICFVVSVLAGYIVLGTLAGSQDAGKFDIFRPATRCFSLLQFGAYLAGLIMFIGLAVVFVSGSSHSP